MEWLILAAIVAVGAWLRFQHLDLLEFKGDEAFAANRALEFVRGGKLPTAGLMSSVGVSNPPLFIWLLIPMFFITSSVAGVCCLIASLGLAAVVATWWIGRKYYSPLTGLIAAALFATAPWAVIYSRKIWAQDFVPVFATATMWAMHAVVVGKKPKAVFWVLFLPICVIQIHYSGFALTATVVAILLLLRPRIDWRLAIAGIVVAGALAVPYVMAQQRDGWKEWKRMSEERSASRWSQLPPGMTINPQSGYPFPRRPSETWEHALAIMNAGEIEDVLGLSTDKEVDPNHIWVGKGAGQNYYFDSTLTFGAWLPGLQRLAFLGALAWFCVVVAKSGKVVFCRKVTADEESKRAWILVLWFVVPLAVYLVSRVVDLFIVLRDPVPRILPGFWSAEPARRTGENPGGYCGGVPGEQCSFCVGRERVSWALRRGAGHVRNRTWVQAGGGEICCVAGRHREAGQREPSVADGSLATCGTRAAGFAIPGDVERVGECAADQRGRAGGG